MPPRYHPEEACQPLTLTLLNTLMWLDFSSCSIALRSAVWCNESAPICCLMVFCDIPGTISHSTELCLDAVHLHLSGSRRRSGRLAGIRSIRVGGDGCRRTLVPRPGDTVQHDLLLVG
jgi:hypothetical protein